MHSTALVVLALFSATAQAGKRGLAWPWYNASLDPGKLNNGEGVTVAIYDWETYPPPSTNGNGGLGFIGTQATTDSSSSPVASLASLQAQQGWATVFSLNEPDLNGPDPVTAAAWYKEWINPLPIKKALPAVTSSTNAGEGLDWLQQMVDACGATDICYADYINLHWYGTEYSDFENHINAAHTQFPEFDVVVTEFALNGASQADQIAFYQQAFAFLDAQSWVVLYFPFVATSPALLEEYGNGAADTVGTGSCLYNNDGSVSAVGELMF